jgi:uncharacterized protein YabE (DUF348 family)
MKFLRVPAFALILFLFGCQQNNPPVTILDGKNSITIHSDSRVPLVILTEAGIVPSSDDRVFVNGIPQELDQPITANSAIQLQLRRAATLTIVTPQGIRELQTSALTVGGALSEAGAFLHAAASITPPPETPITDSMTVTYTPARELVVTAAEEVIRIRSAAGTVGDALARAGIPLTGLDVSRPDENEALPEDGQIQVVRVRESISVALESIPFSTDTIDNPDLAFGQDEIIQPGVEGIAMVRTRIRYEDGREVSRILEDETVLSQAQTRILARGSKIVLSPIGGGSGLEYWHVTEMYATWYSPCNSGTGGCSYGTASGARAGFGIVAVDYSIFPQLRGMRVYVPGYGVATIGDTGGGPIIETALGIPRTKWIDLGYDDNNIGGLSGWVTVYFLAPAPAEIPFFLK